MSARETLSSIARRAGVSPSLVSNIFNGKGRASSAVRERVMSLLEESGYTPRFARHPFYYLVDFALLVQAGKTVSVLSQLEGVYEVLNAAGIPLRTEFIPHTLGRTDEALLRYLETVIHQQPGGVLISTDLPWLEKACALMSACSVPFVQMGYDTEIPRYPSVVLDSFSGAYRATTELITRGHQSIGLIRWTAGIASVNSNKKLAGYRTALENSGLSVRPELIWEISGVQDTPQWVTARSLLEKVLAQPSPPTALLVDNSYISLSLLYPLPSDKGSQLPAEIRKLDIIHFEDWPLDAAEDILHRKLTYPSRQTTLLTIPWHEIGATAASQLVVRVQNRKGNHLHAITIPPQLTCVDGTQRMQR